jgi:hypothetical protein
LEVLRLASSVVGRDGRIFDENNSLNGFLVKSYFEGAISSRRLWESAIHIWSISLRSVSSGTSLQRDHNNHASVFETELPQPAPVLRISQPRVANDGLRQSIGLFLYRCLHFFKPNLALESALPTLTTLSATASREGQVCD